MNVKTFRKVWGGWGMEVDFKNNKTYHPALCLKNTYFMKTLTNNYGPIVFLVSFDDDAILTFRLLIYRQ